MHTYSNSADPYAQMGLSNALKWGLDALSFQPVANYKD